MSTQAFSVILLAVGLFTAFVLGDFIPGMVIIGWVLAAMAMVALQYGGPPGAEDASGG